MRKLMYEELTNLRRFSHAMQNSLEVRPVGKFQESWSSRNAVMMLKHVNENEASAAARKSNMSFPQGVWTFPGDLAQERNLSENSLNSLNFFIKKHEAVG